MASWVDKLDARIAAAKSKPGPKWSDRHESGATCPRCADVYPWRMTYCHSCGCKLR
jgi:hypothetical protein